MTDIIRTFFASLGDLDRAAELITEDAVFIAVREQSYPDLPLYGTYSGAEGLADFVGRLRAAFDTQSFDIDEVLENDDIGFAAGRFNHTVRDTGQSFISHWALMCRFEGGKIASYRFHEDSAALEEAMAVRTICRERV